MPNGNHDFNKKELPMLEKFFGQFSDELESFAERYNLLINKYYHQFHSWGFSFKHPKGGIGSSELIKESNSFVRVTSYWWIDNYDKFTRFSRASETVLIKAKKENIIQILEVKFAEVLS